MDDESIFGEAIKIQLLPERDAYLDKVCGDDDQLRQRIKALLVSHDQVAAGMFLDDPAASRLTANDPELSLVGSKIGQYKLREELGEGGMGIVYAAEQEKPIRRKVALKVIKPGMDTREVIARFEAERQALALMDHQNIARVLDAGATDTGLPYFVMELVRGVTVTEYCDKNRLSIRERLELFAQVCRAIQHAHQKGIIHRDIKPSNVMITLQDGVPVPKVIDFGVAKAMNQRLTEATIYTKVAQVLGTPDYMSPEQAELSGVDIDTRSDIYSLGVLLYKLLTGSTPFTKDQLSKGSVDEWRRVIRETDPQRPSDRVSTLNAEAVSTFANKRNSDPRKLSNLLRGELDWIVMKALEKDRERRYETANGLALDVQRFLDDEPIVARPPSATYRFRKFAQRNKVGIAVGSVFGLFLIAAVAGLIVSNILITRQKNIADRKTAEAELESKYATAIADFVKNDFLALTSVEGQARFDDFGGYELSNNSTLRELLDRAAEKLDSRTDLDPRIEAQLRWIIGENYLGLSEFSLAIKFLEESAKLHRAAYGDDADETLVALNSLGEAYARAGQKNKAQPLFEETYEKRKAKLSDDHIEMLESMNDVFINKSTDKDRALTIFTEILEKRKAILGEDHPDTLESMNNLANIYMRAGQADKAIPLLEPAIELQVTNLGENNLLTLALRANLGSAYGEIGQSDKALAQFEQACETSNAILGEDHPNALRYAQNLANAYADQGRHDDAILLSEQTLERMKTKLGKLGEDHPDTLDSMNSLAELYEGIGDFDKAILLGEQILEKSKAKLGEDHPDTMQCMYRLASFYSTAGQHDKSLPLGEQALEMCKAKLGDDHRLTLIYMNTLAWGYTEAGLLNKAVSLFEQILELRSGKTREDLLPFNSEGNLASAYRRVGHPRKAVPLLKKAFEIRKAKLGEDHPDTLHSMNSLAELYEDIGDFDKAILLGEQILEKSKAKLGEDHPKTLSSMAQQITRKVELGKRLRNEQRDEEADKHFRDALEIFELRLSNNQENLDVIVAALLASPIHLPVVEGEPTTDENQFYRAVSSHLELAVAQARQRATKDVSSSSNWNDWNQIALAYYRTRDWQGAEKEAQLAVELAIDRPTDLARIAPFFLLAGKNEEYHQLCEKVLGNSQMWSSGNEIGNAIMLCSLDPMPYDDPQRLLNLARRASVEGKYHAQRSVAIIYARLGDYENAMAAQERMMQKMIAAGHTELANSPVVNVTLAIVHHLCNEPTEARKWYDKAIRNRESFRYINEWHRMEAEVRLREADRLILGESKD